MNLELKEACIMDQILSQIENRKLQKTKKIKNYHLNQNLVMTV